MFSSNLTSKPGSDMLTLSGEMGYHFGITQTPLTSHLLAPSLYRWRSKTSASTTSVTLVLQ